MIFTQSWVRVLQARQVCYKRFILAPAPAEPSCRVTVYPMYPLAMCSGWKKMPMNTMNTSDEGEFRVSLGGVGDGG